MMTIMMMKMLVLLSSRNDRHRYPWFNPKTFQKESSFDNTLLSSRNLDVRLDGLVACFLVGTLSLLMAAMIMTGLMIARRVFNVVGMS
jgi:hypothetical protein